MTFKYRLLIYAVVGLTIPLLSWILYPEYGWKEPVFFMAGVAVLMTGYEVIIHYRK